MPPKKRELTDDEISQVGRLAAVLRIGDIADFLGIDERTLHRRMKDDERIMSAYKKGRQQAIAAIGSTLLQKARDGNLTAMIFYLKTQARWRETYRMENIDVGKLTDEELEAIILSEDE